MNVFSANCVADGARSFGALPSGARVPLPTLPDVPKSPALTLGVRPHDFSICAVDDGSNIPMIVDVVERLGFEVLVHGRIVGSDTALVVRTDGTQSAVRTGDTVGITVDPKLVHVFDPKTEKSLTA